MNTGSRLLILSGLVIVGVTTMLLVGPSSRPGEPVQPFTWVATANQLGVVGYRDPVGVMSSDGTRLAYSEGRHVRVVPIGGGASLVVPPAEGQVRHLAWGAGGSGVLVAEDTRAESRWWLVDPNAGIRTPLFEGRSSIEAADPERGATVTIRTNALRYMVPSPDGQWLAATAAGIEGPEFWRIALDGSEAAVVRIDGRLSSPAWTPSGETVCVVTAEGRARISTPCGGPHLAISPDVDAVGPLAFSPDATTVYFASPNERGMVDLWSADRMTGEARRLTAFDRDTYAPSVAADGTVLFKTQSYRVFVAETDLGSGRQRQLATFQTETPSYDPTGRTIAVTFGTWRRVINDANYPDIDQHIGTIASESDAPAVEPIAVFASSESEDQAMTWSPNGKWIALHSHRELSDDVWLRPADGSTPDRRITFLGRGAETGWPRWSPDGTTVLLDGASPTTGRSVMFVIGVDQEEGEVTSELREIELANSAGDLTHAEWMGGSDSVVALAREAPGRRVILSVPVSGGEPRVIHRFASEHDFSGLAASPDGREVAFIQRAADGFFQVFRLSVDGRSSPVQVTMDPSHKTQPAWSPDGGRLAYTVWSYQAHFWTLKP